MPPSRSGSRSLVRPAECVPPRRRAPPTVLRSIQAMADPQLDVPPEQSARRGYWERRSLLLRVRWRSLLRAIGTREVRDNGVALLVISALIGIGVGAGVVVVHQLLQALHEFLFKLPPGRLLSEGVGIASWRALLIPILGGLLLGIAHALIRRWRPREIVDAIEANALHGGKLSLTDSLNLTLMTILSGGFGASVGLEAAYTQFGAGIASRVGQTLRVRRSDLRMLVGCGTAAAIAAAFNAPLAGAFYAFELVIGSYAPVALAPVSVAALAGMFVSHWTFGPQPLLPPAGLIRVTGWDYPVFALVGFGAGVLGIVTMLSVTRIERAFRAFDIPAWIRPTLGGAALGLVALAFPQVLGGGHGAIQAVAGMNISLLLLICLVPAKALASALSIGAGFRGGLFSSSLFLGSLFGCAVGRLIVTVAPVVHADPLAYTLVGMAAVAAAIVGAPVTMILLVIELTANFAIAAGVVAAVIIAATVVRTSFGYSFATWRFHLRGVPITGASDIGWALDLTVGRLMRRDPALAPLDLPLEELRRVFPLGGPKTVFLTDPGGGYAGMVQTADVHSPDLDSRLSELTAQDLAAAPESWLMPLQPVRQALELFRTSQRETLAVVASETDRRVVGYVTEAYALRRYNQELELARASDLKESGLFGPG
ncbi:MAG: chloride channel protein [Alphaproteobacteria bacterium]|nr:chloride channel protein [Alphaproteobacteria bacterium]